MYTPMNLVHKPLEARALPLLTNNFQRMADFLAEEMEAFNIKPIANLAISFYVGKDDIAYSVRLQEWVMITQEGWAIVEAGFIQSRYMVKTSKLENYDA